jgi:hypothetical protein
MGYAREGTRGVCYMWEQPWPIAATGHAVGLLGGGLGGHSSLLPGGIGVVYGRRKAAMQAAVNRQVSKQAGKLPKQRHGA